MGDGRRRGAIPPESLAWPRARHAARLVAELMGVTALLFVARFVARGHFIAETDEMCHVGAIAVDVMAHGIRFPLFAYAPVEHNNGAFFSGLLTALSFGALGTSVLARKLVTHLVSSAGVLAALYLLRACLDELQVTRRWIRWAAIAVSLVAFACAPFLLAAEALATVGFASPVEGSALNTLLLALWASRRYTRSVAAMLLSWLVVGAALYLSKATMLVLPALGAATLVTSWRWPLRLLAAAVGFVLGQLPELPLLEQRHGFGWSNIVGAVERNRRAFPHALFDSLFTFAEQRIELVALWGLAFVAAVVWLFRIARQRQRAKRWPSGLPPVALALVVTVALLHLMALSLLAQGGLDHYVVYGYPTAAVLLGVLVGGLCAATAEQRGTPAAVAVAVAAVVLIGVAHRPGLLTWRWDIPGELWRDRAGAACSWHFSEGFGREYEYGLAPPGVTREQHMIARCRALATRDEALDCIGGIARERHVRQIAPIAETPPSGLDAQERRAFAFYHGIHRFGDEKPCRELPDPALIDDCDDAVRLECLVFADITTTILTGEHLARPHCDLPPPPMEGYWAARRAALLAGNGGRPPYLEQTIGDNFLDCRWVFDACYGGGEPAPLS